MNKLSQKIAEQVKEFCALIGSNPLLVQGAGGNISWKDGNVLWVKASGTWLSEAKTKDIFVPVDLIHLRQVIVKREFSATPKIVSGSNLRPSIETFLHALMPQCVVVHLHAIEVLAHLVHDSVQEDLNSLLDETQPWVLVEYYKPGVELATVISEALIQKPTTKVIFLKNHGVVIGGADVAEVNQIMAQLTQTLRNSSDDIYPPLGLMSMKLESLIDQYSPVADMEIQQLALNPYFFKRLSSEWALYPDHVVFLGPRAYTYHSWDALIDEITCSKALPELVFIDGKGVYATTSFKMAKQVQLRCYFDVIVRQKPLSQMRTLSDIQIAELLNWDAEQYRINIAQQNKK
jgi:rhamnose utilization protein RhaD (predicted bifunctional aldolase and dehydrogenase)